MNSSVGSVRYVSNAIALTGASVSRLAMELESMVRLVASAWSDVDEVVVDATRALLEKAPDGAMAVARKRMVVIADFMLLLLFNVDRER